MHPEMWMHPKTCPGRGPEFLLLLSLLEKKTTLLGQMMPVGLQRGRACLLAWLPSAVPCNARGHRATILCHPASSPVLPESRGACVQAERGKGKTKWKGTKSYPGQAIYYSDF